MTVCYYCFTLELIFVALWGMFQLWDTTLDHDPRSIFFDNLTIVWADFKFYKWISSFISVVHV